jgi:dihydroorotate dehydrogenase (NAD+) catalytic subunit
MTSRRLTGMNGSPDLSVRIGRMHLKNPIMPASGTFGYGQEFEQYLDLNRLGAVIVKGTTLKPRTGSYPRRTAEVASGMVTSIGLQNVGVKRFVEEKLPYFDSVDACVIVNIGGHSVEEYVEVARILNRQKRVDALEVNISCPNVKKGGMSFGVDPDITKELVSRVRDVTDKTLIVKLTPMVTDIRSFAEICQSCGADGVSLINAPLGLAIDIETRRSKLGRNVTGGLTGPAIKPFALYLVWQVCKAVDIPVIGVGGISSSEDALEFLIVGASAVEIGTWNFVNPYCTVQVIEGIEAYMTEHNIAHINELIGAFH